VTERKATDKPKPGAPEWPVRNLRPVVREDVTEKELVLLGIVRHFKELGFDLSAYSSLVFGGEEMCRRPEDRIAGKLASTDAETFDRLLRDGVNFASVPRLMSMFLVCFQHQDAKRRNRWKRQFFAGWDGTNFRRHVLGLIVHNAYRDRRSRGLGAKRAMGEIQRILDSPPSMPQLPRAVLTEEELLKKHAIPGARVEALLDEARGALGLRTRPRLKRNRRQIA
jgi:hypothetical protein